MFTFTQKHSIQTDDLCLDVAAHRGPALLITCHGLLGNQNWVIEQKVFSNHVVGA